MAVCVHASHETPASGWGCYPQLMISLKTGGVYLMSEAKTGTLVYSPDAAALVGQHASDWIEGNMVPYGGTITLGNL